jgi:hypothetical protein
MPKPPRVTALRTTLGTQFAKQTTANTNTIVGCAMSPIPSTDAISQGRRIHLPTNQNHPTTTRRQKIQTPVHPDKLAQYLKGYDKELSQYILRGFDEGFRIHADNITTYAQANKNAHIATRHPEAVQQKIEKELHKGHIDGPFKEPPFKQMFISPLSLRQKSDKGWRLLHDLSYPYNDTSVNSSIPDKYKHVKYASIQDAITSIQTIGKNTYMAKTDIASAFTLVPIHPSDYHLLCFKWEEQFYYYKTLPQGAASSCFIFERIATALQWILQYKFGIKHVVHYLDDFLFLGKTQDSCKKAMETFHQLCRELDIPINHSKTEGPVTILSFLGIQLDSIHFKASLPQDKVYRYTALMTSFLTRKTCTLHELQQVIGSLQFTTSVVRPGRTFLRRLINATMGVTKPYHHVHLTNDVKADIQLWITFLAHFNGTSFFIPPVPTQATALNLHTDSCPQGYGGTFKSHYFLGKFPQSWQKFNICVLELYPIVLALQMFATHMANSNIIIHSDNKAVVEVLSHKTTKQPQMLILLRQLVLHCLKHNILFTAQHISGKLNILPDALSRSIHTFEMLQAHSMDLQPTPVPQQFQPDSYKI